MEDVGWLIPFKQISTAIAKELNVALSNLSAHPSFALGVGHVSAAMAIACPVHRDNQTDDMNRQIKIPSGASTFRPPTPYPSLPCYHSPSQLLEHLLPSQVTAIQLHSHCCTLPMWEEEDRGGEKLRRRWRQYQRFQLWWGGGATEEVVETTNSCVVLWEEFPPNCRRGDELAPSSYRLFDAPFLPAKVHFLS